MTSAVEKSFAVLDYLVGYPEGRPLAEIADTLNVTRSGCHRVLAELIRYGFVRQAKAQGHYALTTRLAAMGLSYLSKAGVVDIAQPLLERLAQETEELVRLAIVDGERLTLVAKAQGARSGLRYDPDMGMDLKLSCSAAGHAWLMTLPEDEAAGIVARQGMGRPKEFGPNAPASLTALLKLLKEHRRRGYSLIRDMYTPWMSAMAAPVRTQAGEVVGIIVIAGPSVRLTQQRLNGFAPALLATASEMAVASGGSALFAPGQAARKKAAAKKASS